RGPDGHAARAGRHRAVTRRGCHDDRPDGRRGRRRRHAGRTVLPGHRGRLPRAERDGDCELAVRRHVRRVIIRSVSAPRPAGRIVGDWLLNLLALAGSVCIVLVILGVVFNVSIMMFRTGSMSPTITAGSIALVREIPATDMAVGDVVTVDRGEDTLPVTHRVVRILDADAGSGVVT